MFSPFYRLTCKLWARFPHLLENLEKYSTPGKIMEFCKKIIKIMEIWNFVSPEMWEPWDTVEMIYF